MAASPKWRPVPGRDLLFREQFRVTFDELTTVHQSKGKGVAGIAFLMFPSIAHGELTLLSKYVFTQTSSDHLFQLFVGGMGAVC
jgi:hypothetical protein